MQKAEQYRFENIFTDGGFVRSFPIPDTARKVTGVYFLLDFKGIPMPAGVDSFMVGKLSVLLNNKTDNGIHYYPINAFADENGQMSMGKDYNRNANTIQLNTEVSRSSMFSLVFADSGFMQNYLTDPALAGYNPDLIMYLLYNDHHGDWSNNYFKEIRLVRHD